MARRKSKAREAAEAPKSAPVKNAAEFNLNIYPGNISGGMLVNVNGEPFSIMEPTDVDDGGLPYVRDDVRVSGKSMTERQKAIAKIADGALLGRDSTGVAARQKFRRNGDVKSTRSYAEAWAGDGGIENDDD